MSHIEEDKKSATGRNLYIIERETGMDPLSVTPQMVKTCPILAEIPKLDMWRIPLLNSYLEKKKNKEESFQNTEEINILINTLYSFFYNLHFKFSPC